MDRRAPRFWFAIYGFTAIIMTIAVSVFFWLASQSRKAAGEGRTANAHPQVNRNIPAERLQLLAQFEPPAFAQKVGDSPTVRQALRAYAAHDYQKAIPALRIAAASGPDRPAARFYLGISLLLANDRDAGIQQLREVTAAPDQEFQEPAHFYLAKALLGRGDLTGAEKELENTIALHGDHGAEAHVLLGQIH